MKTKFLLGLFAVVFLSACDKPQPALEVPPRPTPSSLIYTYQENPFTLEIDAKKTDVYVFSSTAAISLDTIIYNTMYRHLRYASSECPLLHSTYDTIHSIKLYPGNYKTLIDNQFYITYPKPWDTIQECDTLRWYHLREVSVFDTVGFVIADTFFRNEFYIGNI